MVYPRKRSVPDSMRVGALADTMFMVPENGWINKEIYLEWFREFLARVRANLIHLLCLQPHTIHILQPLNVGVFVKSFDTLSLLCVYTLA